MSQRTCPACLNELSEWLERPANSLEASHLDECELCQSRLKELVELQRDSLSTELPMLRDDAFDGELSDAMAADPLKSIQRFLAPSEDPGYLGRLGRYEVVGIVGVGGMSVVLKGFERALNRYVAIKMLNPALSLNSIARKRFAREARAVASVLHPNVIPVHHVNEEAEVPYLVMPYLGGATLRERIQEQGWLPIEACLRISLQVAKALEAAHAQGIIHRDIKPANVLIDENTERVVVTDFGLALAVEQAQLTTTGTVAGTPEFMSPEQVEGKTIDPRSDLFSLGCLMQMLATGVSPFRREMAIATLRALIEDPAPACHKVNPDVPSWYSKLVQRLLVKDPAKRLGSAAEVVELIEKGLAHLKHPESNPIPQSLLRRRRFGLWTVGTLACLFALFCVWQVQQDWTQPEMKKASDPLAFMVNAFPEEEESSVARKLQAWKEMANDSRFETEFADALRSKFEEHLSFENPEKRQRAIHQWAIQLYPYAVGGVNKHKSIFLWELSHPGNALLSKSNSYDMRVVHAFACARRGFTEDAIGEVNLLISELEKLPAETKVEFFGKRRTHKEVLHEVFGHRAIIRSINVSTNGATEEQEPLSNGEQEPSDEDGGPDTLNFKDLKDFSAKPFPFELGPQRKRPFKLDAPMRPGLLYNEKNLAVFEIDKNQVASLATRDMESLDLGMKVWARINEIFPTGYRKEIVQFNIQSGRRWAGFFMGSGKNDVNRKGYQLSIAKYAAKEEPDLDQANRAISKRRGTLDWTLVHEMGHYICLRSYAIELFSQKFDGSDMPQPPRRKKPDDYPADGSPKLDGNFVTSYAERAGGDEEVVESFTTYMTIKELPAPDSLAARKVLFFESMPGFPELRAHIQSLGQ